MSQEKQKRAYHLKKVPIIGGEFPHHYPRGKPRSHMSVRMPDPAIEKIDRICSEYGLHKWAAINMSLLAFEHHFEAEASNSCAKNSKSLVSETVLKVWSGLEPGYLEPPTNAQEIFSVYSRHAGCSYEETLSRAAQALLGQWREQNQ